MAIPSEVKRIVCRRHDGVLQLDALWTTGPFPTTLSADGHAFELERFEPLYVLYREVVDAA